MVSNLIPIYQYVLNLQKRLNTKRTITYMQNSLFQHETLGPYFSIKTAHLFNLTERNVHLKKMLLYPSNKANLYQRHFRRAL